MTSLDAPRAAFTQHISIRVIFFCPDFPKMIEQLSAESGPLQFLLLARNRPSPCRSPRPPLK
jgi:hypothetical protein